MQPSRGKGRPRVLYWFRTPPNIKVGRSPFDPAIRRAIEAEYPDVAFDWDTIVHTPIPPPVEPERWRERRRLERVLRAAEHEDEVVEGAPPAEAPNESTAEVEAVLKSNPSSPAVSQEAEAAGALPSSNVSAPPVVEAGETAAIPPGRRRRRRRGRRRSRNQQVAAMPGGHDSAPGGEPQIAEPVQNPGESHDDEVDE
jgi:hypothetical protein